MELPHNTEIEQALVGSVILEPDRFALANINADDFFDRRNGKIWGVMKELQGANWDAFVLMEHLKNNGLLDIVGGYDYLDKLQNAGTGAFKTAEYATTIKEKSLLRQEIMVYSEALERVRNGESMRAEVMAGLFVEELDNRELAVMGDEFITNCKAGLVGHFPWWCDEWTQKMGKLSSELFVLHAPRSTGKTAIMLQWMTLAHRLGVATPLVSIEMLRKSLVPRFIANIGQVNTFVMKSRGGITVDEETKSAQAVSEIRGLNFRIRDGEATIDDIFSYCLSQRSALRRKGIELGAVFIDNLLSISAGNVVYQSKTLMYDHFLRQFRALRNMLECPVIVLAHPNADGQIAWSRDAENFADIILYLVEVPADGVKINGEHIMRKELDGKHVIGRFQKNRDGICTYAHLEFIGQTQTFRHIGWGES